MAYENGTVFVLGAGFTRQFLPTAPLVVDDYHAAELWKKVSELPHARAVLETEMKHEGGRINLEMLMTRLSGRMPYDFEHGATAELDLLLKLVIQEFKTCLTKARDEPVQHVAELRSFANHLLENRLKCVTFNYDDLLDDFLWPFSPYDNGSRPDARFGFQSSIKNSHCPPARRDFAKLLKLHGSLDWRVKLGTAKPYPIDAIQRYKEKDRQSGVDLNVEGRFLEADPFIVPPILTKTQLVEQPILRAHWSSAFEELKDAKGVVFIGYSLPTTDIAATFLFREGLAHLSNDQVQIVDWGGDNSEEKREQLLRSYRRVFPGLKGSQVFLDGATEWITRNITKWLFNSKGEPIAFTEFLKYGNTFNCEGKYLGNIFLYGPPAPTHPVLLRGVYRGQVFDGSRLVFRDGDYSILSGKVGDTCPIRLDRAALPDGIEPCDLPDGFRDLTPEELVGTG